MSDSDIELINDYPSQSVNLDHSKDLNKIKDVEEKLRHIDVEIKVIDGDISALQRRKQQFLKQKEQLKLEIQNEKSLSLSKKIWDNEDYPWSNKLNNDLKNVFKIENLRPFQLSTMNATLSGTDCILIMPTGGGKSLCYQLPALISSGITLVVSPLISLMEDQLMNLERLEIEARMLSASSTKEEVNMVYTAMTDNKSGLKLLYVTPERLAKSKRFMTKLQKMYEMKRFSRLAIDEIHCCSQWGHDFRPDYKFLGIMRQMFKGTAIIGLTATATSRVIQDVQTILNIEGCLVLKASFNRPNLYYEVRRKPAVQKECVAEISKLLKSEFSGQSGIIYTMTIKETEELAEELIKTGAKVAPYHANLEASVRSKIHRKWVKNIYQAVVATIAFGMGIDKPDVRFVVHHCISKSMENFYQESGRAGRDYKPAKCILYWRFADLSRQSSMVFTERTGLDNFYGIVNYCLDSYTCRRRMIADHFDEKWEHLDCLKMCDHCNQKRLLKSIDLSTYGKNLLSILNKASESRERLTGAALIKIWRGKGPVKQRVDTASAIGLTQESAEDILAFLIIDGFLREDFHFTPYNTISYVVPGDKAIAGLNPSQMEIGKRSSNIEMEKNVPSSKRKLGDIEIIDNVSKKIK